MPNYYNASKPDITAWQVESLRTTYFQSPSSPLKSTDWWQDVVGGSPENRIVRMKDNVQQDEGRVNGAKFVLGVQPIRIDWLIMPDDTQDSLWIGTFSDALTIYLQIILRWLNICPPVRRLAFGAILMLPVDDRKSGYELIAKFLPNIQIDPIGTSDFLYQINRPRDSRLGVPNLKINRLAKWSVARRGTAHIELTGQEARASYFPTSEAYACRLELDINTALEFGHDLPYEQLRNILQELVDLGQELAVEGDIP